MNQLPDDSELVKRLQKGDVEAFDVIYERYSVRLYLFCIKYLRSHVEAEELIQMVFLKIWENRKSLIKDASFKSYLFTITYNDICKFFRRRNYQKRFISEVLYTNSEVNFLTEESIDYQSVLDQIKIIVSKMPERQKTVFVKSRFEGRSTKEIAKELKLSSGTVDNYISQALRTIRSNLSKEDRY